MVKKDTIRLQAKVTDALPNAVFKVELEGFGACFWQNANALYSDFAG
jgi:hypothetical protein